MNEFNFDSTEFDANDFDEEIIDMQDGVEINSDFMDIDDPNEISINVSLRNKSSEEITKEVESTLLDLMRSGDREVILSITGESPESTNFVDPGIMDQFSSMYTVAAMYNPAVRWYAKLVKMLPMDKFTVGESGLSLKMSQDVFKKAIVPFLGDFKSELKDESPIVSLIYSISDSIKDTSVKQQVERALQQDGKKVDPYQFDVANVDMADAQLETEDVQVGEVHVDDSGGLGNTEVKRTDTPSISLQDLANKTIAEHFIEDEQIDFEGIRSKLAEEGFTKTRINEILGIVKFIKLNKSMDSRITPEGNRGAGNINFEFA